MKFTKMQGCGNDYVYVNGFTEKLSQEEKPEIVRKLSDRHFGIGGDGVIFINPAEEADFEMEMYNADGSRSEMCGNGIRCVAKYVYDKGLTDQEDISIVSAGKIKYLKLTVERQNFIRGVGIVAVVVNVSVALCHIGVFVDTLGAQRLDRQCRGQCVGRRGLLCASVLRHIILRRGFL